MLVEIARLSSNTPQSQDSEASPLPTQANDPWGTQGNPRVFFGTEGTLPIHGDDHFSFPNISNSPTTSDALGSLFRDVMISPAGSSRMHSWPQDSPKSLAGTSDQFSLCPILISNSRTTPTPSLPPSADPIPDPTPALIPAEIPINQPPNDHDQMEPASLAETIIHGGTDETRPSGSNLTCPDSGDGTTPAPPTSAKASRTDGSPPSNPQVPPIVPSGGDEAAPTGTVTEGQAGVDNIPPNADPQPTIIANNTGIDTTALEIVDEPMEMESGQDGGERGRAGDIGMEEGAANEANTGADRGLTEDVPMDN